MPTWFPSFLNARNAAIAAAIAVPLLILLYFLKLRRREAAVSSTLLWKKAIQDLQVNAPFQRLRRNLLLFLQLALLLLLALAFARPVVNYTPGAEKLTVILIDRSASMNTKDDGDETRLDVAKAKAKEIVASMDRNSSAAVIAFDDSAETVQGFTTDGGLLRRAIDSITPTDRRSRLKLAYQLAEAQSSYNPNQNRAIVRPDVFLYSDGRVLDSDELNINGNVTFVPIGSDKTGNIGVVSLSAKRNYEQPTQVQIFARLANFGPKPVDAQVLLSVAAVDPDKPSDLHFVSRPGGFATVNLPPARWGDAKWVEAHPTEKDASFQARDSVEFTIELTTAAVIRVEQMNKDGDSLAADDAAQVIVPPPKQLAVLHVTDGQNPYLDLALGSLSLQNVKKITPEEYAAAVPTDYDVILFDRYSPKTLPPAGAFVYFGAVPPESVKLQPVKEDGVIVMTPDVRVIDWKRDHPILRGLSLSRIGATEAIKLKPTLDSTVLVDGVNGPLVVLHREGRSTHLVVAFDVLQSNWPLMQSFPVFMHNVIQFMAIGSEMDVRESLAPGATPRIPRANLLRLGGEIPKSITLNGPGEAQTIPIPLQGDFALPALNHVGVYTLSPAVPQFERLAVNLLSDNESNVLPVITPPGNIGQAIVGGQSQSRLELWWWIVAAGVPLLLVEWWVYTRRVHL